MDLRIKYMLNRISEDEFKIILQRREKKIQKKQDITNLVNMFVTCMTDIIYKNFEDLKKNQGSKISYHHPVITKWKTEQNNLVDYADHCFADIADLYQSKKYIIDTIRNH